jgi:hypothetical protein
MRQKRCPQKNNGDWILLEIKSTTIIVYILETQFGSILEKRGKYIDRIRVLDILSAEL